MAEEGSHETAHPAPKGGKADKRRQQLMVGGTVVLVVIGFLTLKKMGSGSGSGSGSGVSGSGPVAGGGEPAAVAAGNQSQIDNLTSQVGILNGKVTDLTALLPLPNPGHGTGLLPHAPIVHNTTPKTPSTHKPKKVAPTKNPATSTGTYTVKKGDSLSSIGRRFGETWQQLYAANKKEVGSNPNLIHPGDKLKVNVKPVSHPAAPASPNVSTGMHAAPVGKPSIKPAHPPTHG